MTGVLLALGLAASQLHAQSPTVAIMVTFEQSALAPNEVCNGSISVSYGEILGLTGVLLDQDDSVEGAGWTIRAPGTLAVPGGRGVVRVLNRPKAIVANLAASTSATVTIDCALGSETVAQGEMPKALFGGKLSLRLVPPAEILTGPATEDDYPSISATPSGDIWVAWQAYDNTDDVVMVRRKTADGWLEAEEITPRGDYHRPRLVAIGEAVWVVWAENLAGNWELMARQWAGDWAAP